MMICAVVSFSFTAPPRSLEDPPQATRSVKRRGILDSTADSRSKAAFRLFSSDATRPSDHWAVADRRPSGSERRRMGGQSISAVDEALTCAGFGDAEIVVIDDGSTDGTVDEAKNLRARTPVRVVSQDNQGRFLARRRGLMEARATSRSSSTPVSYCIPRLSFVRPLLDDPSTQVWTACRHRDHRQPDRPLRRDRAHRLAPLPRPPSSRRLRHRGVRLLPQGHDCAALPHDVDHGGVRELQPHRRRPPQDQRRHLAPVSSPGASRSTSPGYVHLPRPHHAGRFPEARPPPRLGADRRLPPTRRLFAREIKIVLALSPVLALVALRRPPGHRCRSGGSGGHDGSGLRHGRRTRTGGAGSARSCSVCATWRGCGA